MGLHRERSRSKKQRGTLVPLDVENIDGEIEALREDVFNWNHGHPMDPVESPDRQDAA